MKVSDDGLFESISDKLPRKYDPNIQQRIRNEKRIIQEDEENLRIADYVNSKTKEIIDSGVDGNTQQLKIAVLACLNIADELFSSNKKHNKILDEVGYSKNSNGIRFPLNIDFGWPSAKPMAEYMKPQLKKIGIKVLKYFFYHRIIF